MNLTNTNYDIIIAGAGIAGLLLASQLSAHKKVLLLESKNDLKSSKYWVTLASCIQNNPELKPFINNSFAQMSFDDAYRNSFDLQGDYILWNTYELMLFLKQRIEDNEGVIKLGELFCGYKNTSNGIDVFANNNTYSAKLLIDCMGFNSPLVLAKNTITIKGYHLLYGAKLRLKEKLNPICLSNVMLGDKPKFFEAFPTSGNNVFATMIYPTTQITDSKGLATDFKYITTKSIYSKYFDNEQVLSKLWGIVPVGKINRRALDRIFFFGEAAQNGPAASGTCMTRLLFYYKDIALYLNEKIEKDELSGDSDERDHHIPAQADHPFRGKLTRAFRGKLTTPNA